jgi:L-lactate utilization protein LutB
MGMSIPAVHLTKHRVAAVLKRQVAAVKKRWEGAAI